MRNFLVAWKQVSNVSFFHLIKKPAVVPYKLVGKMFVFDITGGVSRIPYTVHPPLADGTIVTAF